MFYFCLFGFLLVLFVLFVWFVWFCLLILFVLFLFSNIDVNLFLFNFSAFHIILIFCLLAIFCSIFCLFFGAFICFYFLF
ncbi:hypothetical protein EHN25_11525 [Salmonella enterica]|nr:hypothetical protein [Salmonella enterica]